MTTEQIILRIWTGRIRTNEQIDYERYILKTGGDSYASTPGNLGFQIVTRDRGDGTTDVTTLSWWASMEAVRAFAGDDPELARYYPEDDRYLVQRSTHVEHHRVLAGGAIPAVPFE